MPAFENKRVKNITVNVAFTRAHDRSHARFSIIGGDLHAGMRADVGKIITVFPDEGFFAPVLYFFLYFYLSNMVLFWMGLILFFSKSGVATLPLLSHDVM